MSRNTRSSCDTHRGSMLTRAVFLVLLAASRAANALGDAAAAQREAVKLFSQAAADLAARLGVSYTPPRKRSALRSLSTSWNGDCDPSATGELFAARLNHVATKWGPLLVAANELFTGVKQDTTLDEFTALADGVFVTNYTFLMPGIATYTSAAGTINQYYTGTIPKLNGGYNQFFAFAGVPNITYLPPHTYQIEVPNPGLSLQNRPELGHGFARVTYAECDTLIEMELRRPPQYFLETGLWLTEHSRYQGTFDACMFHEAYCTGPFKQYETFDACVQHINSLPIRSPACAALDYGRGNSRLCRFYRKFVIPWSADAWYDLGPEYVDGE